MLFSSLIKTTGGFILLSEDREVSAFSVDSRTLTGAANEVFIALKGVNRDGHDYIRHAKKKGVQYFIVEKDPEISELNVIIVKSSLSALQSIAAHHRLQFGYPVLAITGSKGKTIVKEWLATLLSAHYCVIKSPKSYNSQIGVPISTLAMQKDHEIGIFEAGISKKREMENIRDIIRPTFGIFTTPAEAHHDHFFSFDEKIRERFKLFADCKKIICRADAPWYSSIKKYVRASQIVSWSLEKGGGYHVQWREGVIFVNDWKFSADFKEKNALENATHSIVAAIELGLNHAEIQKGISLLSPAPMRLELKKGINGCYVLNDAYHNDIEGLKIAMNYLDAHRENEKKTLILSDMLHTGKSDKALYNIISELIRQKKFDRLIGIGPRIRSMKRFFSTHSLFFQTSESFLEELPVFQDEMILVKGSRDFRLEKVARALEEKNHGTILEVNFEALQYNLNRYRARLLPSTKLMVMVKANAYGSGPPEVANFLQHQRVDQLGVAYVDEAVQLRKSGIELPIMIMNPHVESFSQFEKYDLQPEIFSISRLRQFLADTRRPTPVHLKIDTGMHRLGFVAEEIPELIKALSENPQIEVASIFTHLSGSDSPDHDLFTEQQVAIFNKIYDRLTAALGYVPIKHVCNSSAIVRWPDYHFDMVRLGIGLHGFDPTDTLALKPVSQLKAKVSQVRILKKDETIGYSRKGKVSRESKIAVLPIGYEDGFLRVFGNGNAQVLIGGARCPTIGNICMDMTMVDVTGYAVNEGDEAIIFGENPSVKELAKAANTIPYEILTNISSRVKRVFVSE